MGDLDLGAKVVLREDPAAVLGLFMPDPTLGVIRLAPTERVKLQVLMDSLLEIDMESVGRCWLHFEFLAGWRHDAPQTIFRNWSLALPGHHPLLSIVVVMKPGQKQGPPVNEAVWRVGPLREWSVLSSVVPAANGAKGAAGGARIASSGAARGPGAHGGQCLPRQAVA